jgi:aspartyl-tRNA(Asn)/glutamyl-tRNA(Gln) amidotransferase subunit C
MKNNLSVEEVKKNAALARLTDNPEPEFLEKFSSELGSILGYVDQLSNLPTDSVSPLDGVRTNTILELREDLTDPNIEKVKTIRQNIIGQFPSKKGDLLEVPGVFS